VWSEERAQIARTMWGDGYSATDIANELRCGITRNAILGKVHREGWARGQDAAIGWTEARRRQAAALYKSGLALTTIAQRVGGEITPEAVKTFVVRNNIRRPERDRSQAAVAARQKARELPSPAQSATTRGDGVVIQGRDWDAQKAAATQSARGAQARICITDHGKSSRSAAAGSKGSGGANRTRWSSDPPPRPDNDPVTLVDRRHDQCCWPLGDPQDFENFRYCGARVEREAAPYCAHHARIAYTPSVPRSLRSLDPDRPARRANSLERVSRFAAGA
jgi:hypothetical protein